MQIERKETTSARATLNQAVALDKTEAAAYQGLGELALLADDHAGAESQFRTALKYEPQETVLHLNLATALLDQDRVDEAKSELDRAKEIAPGDPDVSAAFGAYDEYLDLYADALAAYDAAINARTYDPDYYLGRGRALLGLKRYADAIQAGARAIDLGSGEGHTVQAYAYALEGRLSDARAAARIALDADPTDQAAQSGCVWMAASATCSTRA